jgi:hypothetical protein
VYGHRGRALIGTQTDEKLIIFIQEIIQEKYGAKSFSFFIPTLERSEPRFVAHPM